MHFLSKSTAPAAKATSGVVRLAAPLAWLLLAAAPLALAQTPAGVRSIFINGVDISSARSQELRNVDVLINERGDIFIVAPHYQVNEEDTYVPLSQYMQGTAADGTPLHRPPQAASSKGGPIAANMPPQKTLPVPTTRADMGADIQNYGQAGSPPNGDTSGLEGTTATKSNLDNGPQGGLKTPNNGTSIGTPNAMPTADTE